MKKLINILNFFFTNNIEFNVWQKQLFRKYLLNTKNIFFNEFIIENLLPKNWLLLKQQNQNNISDILLNNANLLNVDLWSNYVMLWRYEEQQRLLDNLFKKSRYFKNFDIINKSQKTQFLQKKKFLNSDLSLWYQLGYSIDYLNTVNLSLPLKTFLIQNRSTILLEDSIEYQHKLNIHLVGILDYLSSLYEKDVFIQSKTLRGVFFRYFREIIYPWFSAIILTFMSFFTIIFEFLFLLSSLIAIPLLIYLFIYFILTDAITNFDLETVWLQINFFEFLIQYLFFYFPKTQFLLDYDISIYFNHFCWICIYLFFFFILIFEGAGWMGILATEEDNMAQYLYSDEGTMYEDIHDSCNLRILELMLDLSDHDFTNTDYNNYYIFSDNSDEFRNIESGFSDLNQFAVQLFTGGIGILYMMQTVIQQDDIEDNELHDLYYYDGMPRHNQEYDDDPEFDFGSSLSYLHETDTSFGLYEYPLDAVNIHLSQYGSDYNFFDEEGANVEAFIAMPAYGFEIFSDSSVNYFLEYAFGNSLFDLFLFLIIFFYCLLYFKIYYDWEIWIYREYMARDYFNRITYLGWQHSLTNDEVISDEDLITNNTILDQNVLNVSGYEQLTFSRDVNPIITDIEYFFEDLDELIDFKNEYLREDDLEFVEQDEFAAIDELIEDDEISYELFEENFLKFDHENSFFVKDETILNPNSLNFEQLEFESSKSLYFLLFSNLKNFYLLLINFKNNLNLNYFFQNVFEFSELFILLYKNLSKISNSVLKYTILQLLYFVINLKKLVLSNSHYNIIKLSNLQILFLKCKVKNLTNTTISFEIQNEIVDLLITKQLQENIENLVENSFETEFFDLDNEDFFDVFFEKNYIDDNNYIDKFLTNFYNLLKQKNFFFSFDVYSSLTLYSHFFQNNIIGFNNIFILDEENDLQLFPFDFEDNIEYFNVDIMDVDLVNNNLGDPDALYFYNNDSEEDDIIPDTVYNDDENPYDLFSYDLYFFKPTLKLLSLQKNILKKQNINFAFLKSHFVHYFNQSQNNKFYDYKYYIQEFNNFFLYSWSDSFLENSIKQKESLYNVSIFNDIEFDTNYIEFMDDELYDDESFLVPSQRILLHSLINNFRYETNSWLDGWGTWEFLNINKFEGTLNTFFHYDIFHADDDYDTDEEDMIEMNMTFFSDTLGEMYNDNVLDENSEFLDGIPDYSSIFDDLDGYEEDLLESSFLVEKPYVFIIFLILIFECLTIFFIEYYFILYVFLEPENGDNFFSDLIDYRYTGVFFDILKLKSYNIYLFIFNYLTFDNNIFNEINAYQLIYYSIFCFIDESSGISSIRDDFLQQAYQQNVMLYFLSLYEYYMSKILNYIYLNENNIVEDEEFISTSQEYYEAYLAEKKNLEKKYKNYIFYIIYSIVETVIDCYDNILYYIQKTISCFYYFKIVLIYSKVGLLNFLYYCSVFFVIIPQIIIYFFYVINNYFIIEELHIIYFNFNFCFNYYITYIFIFLWRFSFLSLIYFDYYVYLIINFFFLYVIDVLNIQLLSIFDFTINYNTLDVKSFYFFKLNNYIQTFQYFNNDLIKNITLINKTIEITFNNTTLLIVQFIIACQKLYIIIVSFFECLNFLKLNNLFENYYYLFAKIIQLNSLHFYRIFYIFIYYITLIGCYLFFLLSFVIKLNSYDLYLVYIYCFVFFCFNFFYNIYFRVDYNLIHYSINRFQQFDDKYYYNRETINIKPEILYDIETLTFFNNSIDSYIYWL